MKKQPVILVFLFLCVQFSIAQDFFNEFIKSCEEKDTIAQRKVLEKWNEANPEDPEVYTSYFNYYLSKSRQEVIHFTDEPGDQMSLQIQDSTNAVKGYMVSKIIYDQDFLKKGFDYIDAGIKKFPNRLDMRFGKIYALGQMENWDVFTSEIFRAIEYSAKNDNQWIWTHDEKVEKGKEVFLTSLQDYQVQLFNTQNKQLLGNLRSIAQKVLQYYPDHVESLSNISVSYLLTQQYEKALEPLLKAEKIDPKDHIVIGNIAYAYKMMGNKEKAILYYEKNVEIGDEQAKAFAQEQLEELKK